MLKEYSVKHGNLDWTGQLGVAQVTTKLMI